MSQYQLINFFGGPGAGKGTQVFKLAESSPFTVLGMSSMIQRFIATHDTLDSVHYDRIARMKECMANGELVDFEDVKVVMIDDISQLLAQQRNLLFEGFPRNEEQARWFADFLDEKQIPTLFIHLEVQLEEVINRIKNRYWVEGTDKPFISYQEALRACPPGTQPFQRELDTDVDITKKRFAVQYADFKDDIIHAMQQAKNVKVVTIQANQNPEAVFAEVQAAVADSTM